jgi:hypothetical protein
VANTWPLEPTAKTTMDATTTNKSESRKMSSNYNLILKYKGKIHKTISRN